MSEDCPLPLPGGDRVLLAHGGGGRAMASLLRDHVAAALGPEPLRHDGAVVRVGGGELVVTTDSFVVRPAVFPGGDIGRLAVCGTVNDLLVSGAVPEVLTLALILEEGLPLALLDRVLASVRQTADEVGVRVVTGDTKVVPRGQADGLYVNTTGLGRRRADVGPWRIQPGDRVLVTGDLGRHAVAVLSERDGLGFETDLVSDCAPLTAVVDALVDLGDSLACLRDPTRGGLQAVLHELAEAAAVDVALDADAVPAHPTVRAACELYGFEPWALPCEGRAVAFVRAGRADEAVAALRAAGAAPAVVGEVRPGTGRVWVRDGFGGERASVLPYGELLPRIC